MATFWASDTAHVRAFAVSEQRAFFLLQLRQACLARLGSLRSWLIVACGSGRCHRLRAPAAKIVAMRKAQEDRHIAIRIYHSDGSCRTPNEPYCHQDKCLYRQPGLAGTTLESKPLLPGT